MRVLPNMVAVGGCGLVAFVVWAGSARADGIPAYRDGTGWRLAGERAQFAAVALRDGMETLLLQVALDEETTPSAASRLVWLTPVPAPAAEIHVDVLRGFPHFFGVEPAAYLADGVQSCVLGLAATQLWPIMVAPFFLFAARGAGSLEGVEVFAVVREAGLEVQVLEAPSLEALRAHLESLGVGFPEPGLAGLRSYLGPGRSLVLARVEDLAAYRQALRADGVAGLGLGVSIRFPAAEGFFPLVASAALPGGPLMVVVTAVGFHEPLPPSPPGLSTEHYLGSAMGGEEASAALGLPDDPPEGKDQDFEYTRFRLLAEPRELTEDLRFAPGAPARVRFATGALRSPWLPAFGLAAWLLLVAGLGALSSLLSRGAWPAHVRPGRRLAALLGLANLGTWLGYLVASLVYGRRRGVAWRHGLLVAVRSNLVFCLAVALLWTLAQTLG